MIDDLFVPDPPAGDSSNRIPTTRFVQNAATSAAGSFPSIAGLSVVGNASTAAATAAAITAGVGDEILVSNHALTTVLFTSVSSFLDNAISSTQGVIVYRNAATWVALPPGTNGQFLQTQGATANPQWAGAAMVLLNTLNVNGLATTADTTSLTSTYGTYEILIESLQVSIRGAAVYVQFHSGGAFASANYVNSGLAVLNSGSPTAITGTTGAVSLSNNNADETVAGLSTSAIGMKGQFRIINPAVSSSVMATLKTGYIRGAGSGINMIENVAAWNSSGVVDGFLLGITTGVMTAVIKVIGLP